MLAGPRLRQVAVVAADYEATVRQFQAAFGWADPYRDPGVGRFGLINAVFAAGDTFVEVVTPVQPDAAAGRYRDARGGDSGYMAIFQLPELAEARRRVAAAGIRVVWSADLADIAGTHLHPKDVPGAIVSLDWADPPQSWRWAGPAWTGPAWTGPAWTGPAPAGQAPAGQAPAGQFPATSLSGLTIEVTDPPAAADRWAQVLGLTATQEAGAATIHLGHAAQDLRFVPVTPGQTEGITEVRLASERPAQPVKIAGVRFTALPRAAPPSATPTDPPGGEPA